MKSSSPWVAQTKDGFQTKGLEASLMEAYELSVCNLSILHNDRFMPFVSPGMTKFTPAICSNCAKINCIPDLDCMFLLKLLQTLGNVDPNKPDVCESEEVDGVSRDRIESGKLY